MVEGGSGYRSVAPWAVNIQRGGEGLGSNGIVEGKGMLFPEPHFLSGVLKSSLP